MKLKTNYKTNWLPKPTGQDESELNCTGQKSKMVYVLLFLQTFHFRQQLIYDVLNFVTFIINLFGLS